MKNSSILLSILLSVLFYFILLFQLSAQVTFEKTVNIKKYDDITSVIQRSDGSYMLYGIASDSGSDLTTDKILIVDTNGTLIQLKRFDCLYCGSYKFIHTKDGGYVYALGQLYDSTNIYTDVALLKTDAAGNILWFNKYFNIGSGEFQIAEDALGNLTITGFTDSIGAGYNDVLLSKFDLNGNLLWGKTYGGVFWEEGYYTIPTLDGGYAIAGKTVSFGAGASDYLLIKTDSGGNLQWVKTFGGTNNEDAYYVDQLADGGFFLSGWTQSFGAGGADHLVVRTDSNGNLQWAKTFGGSGGDYFSPVNQISKTFDGKYVIPGQSDSYSSNRDILLIEIDSGGNLYWAKTYGTSENDEYPSVYQTIDGGFFILGETWQSSLTKDTYIIKTDENGISRCNDNNVTITLQNTPVTVTVPNMLVSSVPIVQATVVTTVSNVTASQTTLCYCNITADFTYSINNSQMTIGNTSQNATNWLWNFGDGNNSTLQNPVNTYSTNGSYQVCLTASDSSGCSDSTCHIINITTGINEPQDNNSINIYPNPSSGILNISYSGNSKEIFITDMIGQRVLTIEKETKSKIDISDFPAGIYFLNVKTESGALVRKIIKE